MSNRTTLWTRSRGLIRPTRQTSASPPGGTVDGGVDTDPTPNRMTFDAGNAAASTATLHDMTDAILLAPAAPHSGQISPVGAIAMLAAMTMRRR